MYKGQGVVIRYHQSRKIIQSFNTFTLAGPHVIIFWQSLFNHHCIREHNFLGRHEFWGATFSWINERSTDQVNSPLQLGSAQSLWSLSLACLRSMWTTMRPRQAQIFVLSRILGHVSPWLLRIWKRACVLPGLVLSTETSNSAGRRCATKKSPNLFDSPKN